MADLPARVQLREEGPREGFQIEKGPIATARKVELIDALSQTGLEHIQIVSFVNPAVVPGMADAEAVVDAITPRAGVAYYGLWLNDRGFERALAAGRLTIEGTVSLTASATFLKRNQNRTPEQQVAATRGILARYRERGVRLARATIMAAFGCNFEGDIPLERVVGLAGRLCELAADEGMRLEHLSLADTMGWATPRAIKRAVGAVRAEYPDLEVELHLHDTRGLGIANAAAGLEMGVARFDASVAGLGGCPFAGHAGAAGNVCTEDLAFMCEEMGIETGIDLERLAECARLAEEIVGHPLPGSVKKGGTLGALRARIAEGAHA